MSEPPAPAPHYLEFHAPRMWKGELELTSLKDHKPVGALLITQITGPADVLRLDWNGETVAELDRRPFHTWLHAGDLIHTDNLRPFTGGQVTWFWKGPGLHVAILGIEHVFPATALYELRMLAVR